MLKEMPGVGGGETALQAGWNEFRHLVLAGLLGSLGVGLVALASSHVGRSADFFTREPQVVLNGEWYAGSFSSLGGLVWFGAAAIMSLAASFRLAHRGGLALAALVTWAMGVDDVFMLHDVVYPALQVPNSLVLSGYLGAIGVMVVRWHGQLARSTLVGVAIAVTCWSLSALLDRYFNHIGQLAEDGVKFIGIVVWAAAWTREVRASMLSRLVPEGD